MFHVGLAQLIGTLNGLTYSESTSGGNVFVDGQPTAPDRSVTVFASAGAEADTKLPYDPVEALIIVRSDADTAAWALTTWQAIYDLLHGYRNRALPDGTYVAWVIATTSSPNRLGADANARQGYGMTVRAEVLNTAPGRETA
jgi:hypothetical protein